MSDFGDVRSACHARDLRALIEVAYVNGRYTLGDVGTSYVQAVLPEYEHEVWVWARAMVERLLEVTNVPLEMVRGFAATWAEWMLAGATGHMSVSLHADYHCITSAGFLMHEFSMPYNLDPKFGSYALPDAGAWRVRWRQDFSMKSLAPVFSDTIDALVQSMSIRNRRLG